MRSLVELLEARTDPRPLALCRIILGAAAFLRGLVSYHLLDRLLRPETVSARWFEWLPPITRDWMLPYVGAWLVAAALFTLGYRTRWAGGALTALIAYHLAADQSLFWNHIYFLGVMVFLLTVADSDACYSVKWLRAGRPKTFARQWGVTLIKLQISLVYFYAACAKLNPTFLSGEVIERSLAYLPGALAFPGFYLFTTWATIALEFFLPFALWRRSLRMWAIAGGLALHGLIPVLIGLYGGLVVFSTSIVSTYLLFLDEREYETLESFLRRMPVVRALAVRYG